MHLIENILKLSISKQIQKLNIDDENNTQRNENKNRRKIKLKTNGKYMTFSNIVWIHLNFFFHIFRSFALVETKQLSTVLTSSFVFRRYDKLNNNVEGPTNQSKPWIKSLPLLLLWYVFLSFSVDKLFFFFILKPLCKN